MVLYFRLTSSGSTTGWLVTMSLYQNDPKKKILKKQAKEKEPKNLKGIKKEIKKMKTKLSGGKVKGFWASQPCVRLSIVHTSMEVLRWVEMVNRIVCEVSLSISCNANIILFACSLCGPTLY